MLALYLQGKKTIIVGVLMIVYAGIGFYLHQVTQEQAIQLVLTALGLLGVRSGVREEVASLYKALKTPTEPTVLPK